ncbi:glycosyltransferase family 4 protein [Jeotgalibacillus sp. ET6]|uniref:glycosyltransferase family 4 protein n=1 Tax=Jeotgalibacillus sp. ET6 TaxID=3037260 RepID=UPI00241845D8|nr:glycosyltransferase family 4 protein [Jeotgalibacillus sp. ET6]MDG5471362.1 glycosyltransferase family 4 protein [Jeotgalibacillus sp. ET6]
MKIVVLSSHTSSLFWFRMDMMKSFLSKGHTVIAVGSEPESAWKAKFQEFDIDYRQLPVERNGLNPLNDLKTFKSLYEFMKKEKPDKVFAYQAKTIVYGSIAAKLNGISEVYPLVAGLGSVFRGNGVKNEMIKNIMKLQYRVACMFSKKIFFQNHDDKNEFLKNGLVKENKTVIINGSGVDLSKFKYEELPEEPSFLFIGRLIKDKGIMEYLEACNKIKLKYPRVRCLLVGPYDSNPSAITKEELKPYIDDKTIEYFGEQDDVRPFITQCSTFILPSYHEGTPKTVLEAMAMGRSIITTEAPGCRETVVDGVNGYLVKVKSVNELEDRMEKLINNKQRSYSMGQESAKIAIEKYDVKKVNQTIIQTMGI